MTSPRTAGKIEIPTNEYTGNLIIIAHSSFSVSIPVLNGDSDFVVSELRCLNSGIGASGLL